MLLVEKHACPINKQVAKKPLRMFWPFRFNFWSFLDSFRLTELVWLFLFHMKEFLVLDFVQIETWNSLLAEDMRVRSIHSIMVLLCFLFRRSLIITFFEYVLFHFGVKFPLLWVSVVLIMSLVSSFSAHFKASCICINIAFCRCVENVAKETKSPFHNVSLLSQILTSDS